MRFEIPELCLVVLVGPPGSGKTTLARKLFSPTEVLSADAFRAMISDSEENQVCSDDAFRILLEVARTRLRLGRLTVVDACHFGEQDRKGLLEMARECFAKTAVIVLDLPARQCAAGAAGRTSRPIAPDVVRKLHNKFVQEVRPKVLREKWGFRCVLKAREEQDALEVCRVPMPTRRRDLSGPFDIIGDVHGCYDELVDLVGKLGYSVHKPGGEWPLLVHPEGRTAVFVGDLVDRGPRTPDVLRLIMGSVARNTALCVLGNHDDKCARALQGKSVTVHEGLRRSLDQIEAVEEERTPHFPGAFRDEVVAFVSALPSHLVLDGGKLVVAHAGLPKPMHGRDTDEVTQVAKYGQGTGEHDDKGHAVRLDWAAEYRGAATVVYGHIVEAHVRHVNNTYCLDTGCVFGNELTALRYPEMQVVSTPARELYIDPDFVPPPRWEEHLEARRMRRHFEANLLIPLGAGREAIKHAEALIAQHSDPQVKDPQP